MRVTNQMMTSNMLNNINRNKVNSDKLGYQYATQNKIQKPSDDPVVAVRSLKFRTQITEITQYLEKNIPDATNWMKTTEDAMTNINDILKKIDTYCNNGANDTLETTDRSSIIATLEQYKEQIFASANADYAGRYLFTGFRTDTPLLYDQTSLGQQKSTKTIYTITENLSFSNVTSKTYVKGGAAYVANTPADDYAADAASTGKANRLQLSYTNLDKEETPPREDDGFTRTTGIQSISFTNPSNSASTITVKADGSSGAPYSLKTVSISDLPQGSCYTPGDNEIYFIPETGEMIFGSNAYTMAQVNSNYSVVYTKSEFQEGDIIPQHYFECTANSIVNTGAGLVQEDVSYTNPDVQKINYEINFSQKLTVNTLAKDAVSTTISTKIDEIIQAVNDVYAMADKISEVTKLLSIETNETEIANLTELKAQLETEQTLKKSILRESFSSGMTMSKKAQDVLNVALSNHGSRHQRLELTQARLEDQKTSFTELLDSNDKVELEESVINYKQAQTVYDASLMCASTIITKTLLDYL